MKSIFRIFVLCVASLVLTGCWRPTYEWRQKLTLTVATPEGDRSGSAVISERVKLGQLPLSGNAIDYKIIGEAAVVEIAPGKYLFALLSDLKTKALAATLWKTSQDENYDVVFERIEAARDSRPVPEDMYPLLVTFDDIGDPKSVKEVAPTNLAAAFGPGYALKSMTLEITDEPVTEGDAERVLGWLDQFDDKNFDGSRYHDVQNSNLANRLSSGFFRTEK